VPESLVEPANPIDHRAAYRTTGEVIGPDRSQLSDLPVPLVEYLDPLHHPVVDQRAIGVQKK
jgi:hypothetical protein